MLNKIKHILISVALIGCGSVFAGDMELRESKVEIIDKINVVARNKAAMRVKHGQIFDLDHSIGEISKILDGGGVHWRFVEFAPRLFYYEKNHDKQQRVRDKKESVYQIDRGIKERFLEMAAFYKTIADKIDSLDRENSEKITEEDIREHLDYLAVFLYGIREMRPADPFGLDSTVINLFRQAYAEGFVVDRYGKNLFIAPDVARDEIKLIKGDKL